MLTSTRSVLALLAATVLLAAGTGAAVANHVFPDVASTSAFHSEVANVAGAGCATGYPGGNFRPRQNINRQQAAAWLNRCGGRSSFDDGFHPTLNGIDRQIAQASVTAGAATGGGWVDIHAAGTVGTLGDGDTGCPCDATFYLTSLNGVGVGDSTGNNSALEHLPARDNTYASFAIVDRIRVSAGSTVTVTLTGDRSSGSAVLVASGQLSLSYVPFSGNGTPA